MIEDDMRWFAIVVGSLVVLVPTSIGVSVIVTGVRRWLRARRLHAHGVPTIAVVVDNQQESLSEGRIRFLPVVSFRTATGQEVRTVLEDLAAHRSHLAGTEHPIVYDPDDPRQATAPGRPAARLVGAIGIGLVFLAFAAFAYRLAGPLLTGDDPLGMP